ncbi:hypothetical protein ATCC90586_002350 [Pythium insidiosum]|nr:hypothetical protein ATCC90586_002350 [Pythium insidiosum]
MKSAFAGVAALVIAVSQAPVAQGWWDNGHMLCGEVASQLMDKADVATIKAVLSKWDNEFPNLSDLSTATAWADQLKCKEDAAYCKIQNYPSFPLMDDWHYVNLPLYVNGANWGNKEPSVDLVKDALEGNALNVLEKTMGIFQTTKSVWAANLAIRNFLHVFSDLHQPLHTVAGISTEMPGGDRGGNNYRFSSPCDFPNLHALWDAAAGTYSLNNWQPNMDTIRPELQKNATALIQLLPMIYDVVDLERYKKMPYKEFASAVSKNNIIKNIALDSYSFARQVVYAGLDLKQVNGRIACPSKSYLEWASFVAQTRIAVGGKRLAVFMTQFASQLRSLGLDK